MGDKSRVLCAQTVLEFRVHAARRRLCAWEWIKRVVRDPMRTQTRRAKFPLLPPHPIPKPNDQSSGKIARHVCTGRAQTSSALLSLKPVCVHTRNNRAPLCVLMVRRNAGRICYRAFQLIDDSAYRGSTARDAMRLTTAIPGALLAVKRFGHAIRRKADCTSIGCVVHRLNRITCERASAVMVSRCWLNQHVSMDQN